MTSNDELPADEVPVSKSKVTRDLSTNKLTEHADPTDQLSRRDFLVLVVDDVIDNVTVISLDLQQQGYRVITAADGEQAVKIAIQTNPDIILMDIGMPEMDGLTAARRIRESEGLKTVPIIAITAFGTAGFQRAAYDAGFDAYLKKPIDFDRLHDLVRSLLPVK
jgi:CheY-like chemotaxis protein